MGKELLRIGLLTAAIIAIAACSKEENIPVEEHQAPEVHYATVILSKEDVTKTAVVEGETQASYVWTVGDDEYLHVYENGIEGEIQSIQYGDGYATATITVEFTGTPTAPYTYTATYAKTMSSEGHPMIRADQRPAAKSFDPAADVMISRATADVTNLGTRATVLSFTMGRVVSVNKMTLTGLVAGEKVSKVEFTLGSNFLGGYYADGAYNSASNKLTAIYDTPLAVGSDGKFPVYFTCAPVDGASIESVVVTTDQNVYTKSSSAFSGKSISFAVGTMKRFNMGMIGLGVPVETPASNIYTKVQNESGLVSGASYLIVGTSSKTSIVYALGEQKSNNRTGVVVTVDNGTITLDNTINAHPVVIETITDDYYALKADNKYLYTDNTTANRLFSRDNIGNDNYALWTVSITNSGFASIKNVGNIDRGTLCFNPNWQNNGGDANPIFAGYNSVPSNGTASLNLYANYSTGVPSLLPPTNLTAENNNGTVHVEWDAVTDADSYTVTCTGQTTKTGLTVCSTDFTGLAAGTYTITVTAISNNHNVKLDSEAASKDVTVTITAATGTLENPYSASAAIEEASKLASNTNSTDKVYVTGIISSVDSYSSKYHSITYKISDDGTTSNEFMIYGGLGLNGTDFSAITDLAVGYKVVVYGFLRNYNGNTPEMYQNSEIISLLVPSSATVTTGNATGINGTQAILNGSFSGASGQIYETGFYYGPSSTSLTSSVTTDGTNNASGSFNCSVTGLTEGNTYYYKAYVLEYNAVSGQYEERYGDVRSFTTSSSVSMAPGYLSCYEVPAIPTLSGTGTNGTNTDRGDTWYRYYTTNSNQQVATHCFSYSPYGKTRNYTVLYDQTRYAPLWVAYAMQTTRWPKILSGRSGSWGTDPAISFTQQTGLDNAQTVGYSRGHMVSSQERQTNADQNEQTFYYTNQAPQWQNGFNSGIWSTMEGDIVSCSPSGSDTLYVVTGVLYEGTVSGGVVTSSTVPTKSSGSLNVPIPSHFYKCLMKCSFNSNGTMTGAVGCAFIFTNESHTGVSYTTGLTTINAIEQRSGFDFFANVPDNFEETAEATATNVLSGASSNSSGGSINDVNDSNWGDM